MLKSLELFGFKSFADRTRFDFSPGITGVVGPNGSGKSNVVDAIKWILGDQSAKSLRGKEMTDVIFNGSSGRKANSFAEATLTFDNRSGFLGIEAEEVQIGRRIWRNGDSEYLINRGAARLKDIRELLMGTGAGASAYCIIEQGRVDQILQSNPTNRRLVFEEAAGISRFKSRKAEALRKLERVDQNLLRLTDIVDEVEAQLNSTRNQAVKAAKYREVSEELRTLWQGLAADDYRYHSRQLEQVEQVGQDDHRQLEQLNAQQRQLEERISALDRDIADVDDRLRSVERNHSTDRENIASHEATIRHQTARRLELETEVHRLQRQLQLMGVRDRDIAQELRQTRTEMERFEDEFTGCQNALTAREQQIAELAAQLETEREQVEQNRQQVIQKMREISATGQNLTGLESQLAALKDRLETAEHRRSELDAQIAQGEQECAQRRERAEEAQARVAELEERIRTIQSERKTLIGEQDQFQKSLAEQREQRSAGQARKAILEDLENRQEGLGIGVKEILNRAQTSDYPPWNRILGSVADLLDVDLDKAALLEVALGSRAQLIVLEEFDSLIDYLNGGTCQISGRVGFISLTDASSPGMPTGETRPRLTHFRIDPETLPELDEYEGVVCRADELARSAKRTPRLAEYLLADTWVVETLDIALGLSAGPGRGARFVTLQGELLNPDGSLYAGTIRSESALVSRKSELRRLKNELIRLDRKIAEQEHRLSTVGDSLTHVDDELEAADLELQSALEESNAARSEWTAQEKELGRSRTDLEAAQAEVERLSAHIEQIEEELRLVTEQLAQAEADLQSLQERVAVAEREISDKEHTLQTLEQGRTAEQLSLAKQEERLSALRNAHRRLEHDLQQRQQQREEAERRFEAATTKCRQITLHILNATAELAELFLNEEQLSLQAASLLKQKADLRVQRSEVLTEEAGLRQKRRELSERQHQQEMRSRDIRHQLNTLAERIEEEYQLDLTELVASGVSAVRLFRNESSADSSSEKTPPEEAAQQHDENVESMEGTSSATESDEMSPAESPADEAEGPDHDTTTQETWESGEEPESEQKPESDFDEALYLEIREDIEARVNRLRKKLKLMGNVNTDSLRDLDELEHRYEQMSAQLQDLVEAKSALEEIVRKINTESKRLFFETFESIRGYFQELFRKVFGGGEGDIVLEDPDDVLECGIDIVARPPGKELRSISLLSGGEKTMTAVALLMAIFKSRPSPFCILDEVDAALDDANVDRYVGVLKEFQETTQFIMITHRKPSMTVCDMLYGVTMEQSGVSKRMSVRFEDVNENGEFKAPPTERGHAA